MLMSMLLASFFTIIAYRPSSALGATKTVVMTRAEDKRYELNRMASSMPAFDADGDGEDDDSASRMNSNARSRNRDTSGRDTSGRIASGQGSPSVSQGSPSSRASPSKVKFAPGDTNEGNDTRTAPATPSRLSRSGTRSQLGRGASFRALAQASLAVARSGDSLFDTQPSGPTQSIVNDAENGGVAATEDVELQGEDAASTN